MWPIPEMPPWRGPGTDCSWSWGTPCQTLARPVLRQLRWTRSSDTLTSAWKTGGRGIWSLRRCWMPLRRRPGPSALNSSSSGTPAYEESTMSQESLQRENSNLQGTLSRAWSQSGSKVLWQSPGLEGTTVLQGTRFSIGAVSLRF